MKEFQKNIDLNANALSQSMDVLSARRISELAAPDLGVRTRIGSTKVTGPRADLSQLANVREFERESRRLGGGGAGGLRTAARRGSAVEAFGKLNAELTRLANLGNESAESLQRINDQRLAIDIYDDFVKQTRLFQEAAKGGDKSAGMLNATLATGMGLLRKRVKLTNLSSLSAEEFDEVLKKVTDETQKATGATDEEALAIRALIEGHLNLVVRRNSENSLIVATSKSLKRSQTALQLFSLEIKRLGEATVNAAADFGIAINNIVGNLQSVRGGAVPQADVFGRFRGTDEQFSLLEQNAPAARQLRNLQNLEGKLPTIIERTLKAAQKKEAESGDRLTQRNVDDILRTELRAVAGDVPDAVFQQIRAAIQGGSRQAVGGSNTADPVVRLKEILRDDAEAVQAFSGIITQGAQAADSAFEAIKKILSDYAKVVREGIQIEEKTIQNRLQLLNQFDQGEDRLRTARGGRANITSGEARTRRTRRLQTMLGIDPGEFPNAPTGIQAGGQELLAVRQRLLAERGSLQARKLAGPDTRRRAARRLPPNDMKEIIRAQIRNSSSLERVNKALGMLTSDTTELTAALNELQQTVQRQIQAEQSIGTLADAAEALAKGDMTPFDFQERFGPSISGFEKLKEATLTGQKQTFGFEEVQALRKALTGGSPLLDAQLRALADRATSPGGGAAARFKGRPEEFLASLRADFTKLAGTSALQSLQGAGVGPQALGFLQDSLKLQEAARQQAAPGGAQAAEVGRILAEQRALIEATGLSDQALFATQMALATRSFDRATGVFSEAVKNFELKVSQPPAAGGPGAGGGPVNANNRGGVIKRFATGGRVRGPSHAQGGVLAELEGGEFVLPKNTVRAMQSGGEVITDQQVIRKYSMFANKFREQTGHSVATNPLPMFVGHGSGGRWIKPHTNKDGSIGYSVIHGKSQDFQKKAFRNQGLMAMVQMSEPLSDEQPAYVMIREGQGYHSFVNEMASAVVDPSLRRGVVGPMSPEQHKRLEHRNKALDDFRRYEALREKGYDSNAIERLQMRAWGAPTISRHIQHSNRMKDAELYSDLLSAALTSEHGAFPGVAGLRPTRWSGAELKREASAYRNPKVGNRRSSMRHERRVLSPEPQPLLGPVTKRQRDEWRLFGPNHPGTQHLRHKFLSHAGQVPFETGSLFDELPRNPRPGAGKLLDSVRENLIKSFGEDAQGFAGGGVVYAQSGKLVKGKKGKGLAALQKFWAKLKGEKNIPSFGQPGATGMRDPFSGVAELTSQAGGGSWRERMPGPDILKPLIQGEGRGPHGIDRMMRAFRDKQYRKHLESPVPSGRAECLLEGLDARSGYWLGNFWA